MLLSNNIYKVGQSSKSCCLAIMSQITTQELTTPLFKLLGGFLGSWSSPWLVNRTEINKKRSYIHSDHHFIRGRRGCDRMVVGFTTTYAIGAYHHWCLEFESRSGRGVQHYVIRFVSDSRQVVVFSSISCTSMTIRLFRIISSPSKFSYFRYVPF